MRFQDFEKVMSRHRMNRYLMACNGRSKKAMTLYRLNLRLSQEMFTIISCFEVALRNAIDTHYLYRHRQSLAQPALTLPHLWTSKSITPYTEKPCK